MSKITELQSEVESLRLQVSDFQDAVNVEQEEVKQAIADLQKTIDDLIANNGTPEEIQAVIASLQEIKGNLQTAKDDLVSTISETTTSTTSTTTTTESPVE